MTYRPTAQEILRKLRRRAPVAWFLSETRTAVKMITPALTPGEITIWKLSLSADTFDALSDTDYERLQDAFAKYLGANKRGEWK